MLWAFTNDLFQRLVTFNKLEQRKNLSTYLNKAGISPTAKVLDFGCGTGLFARVFTRRGMTYWGYDIDPRLLNYAHRLNPKAQFTSSLQGLQSEAPFDLIIANCCFHHIPNEILVFELERISNWLTPQGRFLMIDLFEEGPGKSPLRKLFLKLEQGAYFRTPEELRSLLEKHFHIGPMLVQECHLIPGIWTKNLVASSLMVADCTIKTTSNK